ncbi:MAG: hypothetical protein N2559_16720 [Anaerolineae bacterium]|nr:hypothetical protein [Anaerolineae bacterium]
MKFNVDENLPEEVILDFSNLRAYPPSALAFVKKFAPLLDREFVIGKLWIEEDHIRIRSETE